ncbi:hypothetical protein G6O67_003152 [Ophiocordyceps sinensis]|uniref:ABC transporter, transmembrane domain, type 1 n=1 Tax=Ophiocordyceps sinensis TaxID=72228 RepID=A0A8H4PVL7_9HYPO|nr:hypothetical protein G6O67_003152 [Ophiocordyceps sinensis]
MKPCNDDSFGPVAKGCYRDFDFTILFENTILSILPSLMVILAASTRIWHLHRQQRLVAAGKLQVVKLLALAIYTALQAALVSFWSTHQKLRSWSSMTAAGLALVTAVLFCLLSYLEHGRNIRPSSILLLYCTFSTLLDAVRARTVWLVYPASTLAALAIASVVAKTAVLVLESHEKSNSIMAPKGTYGPESISSVLNRSIFFWLNRVVWNGARTALLPGNVDELPPEMTSASLGSPFLDAWAESRQKRQSFACMRALFATLKWPILKTLLPRFLLLAFTVCQPVLLHDLIENLGQASTPGTEAVGKGLVGAYALVYIGIAVATGAYWYHHYRVLTMIRACLVSAVGWQTLRIDVHAMSDPKAPVTLMSTDVERILFGLRSFHEFWATVVQVGILTYLLHRQLGVALVVPVVVTVFSSMASVWVSRSSHARQSKWMQAAQYRIGATSNMLSSIKAIKMRALVVCVSSIVRDLRLEELMYAARFRILLVWTAGLGYMPQFISPLLTFLVFVLSSRATHQLFDASRAFTSLSLLLLIAQSLSQTLLDLPSFLAAFASSARIDEFLSVKHQTDFRDFDMMSDTKAVPADMDYPSMSEGVVGEKAPGELPLAGHGAMIQISQGSCGWGHGHVLEDISLSIPRGQLTLIVGPVACGKSTLCHALLGETPTWKGKLCFLAAMMPSRDKTVVGSDGINLSGGQRQKVALARAFEGSNHIFWHVMGPEGIARRQNITVVFATHATQFLPFSDHIVALSSSGKVAQQGDYPSLCSQEAFSTHLTGRSVNNIRAQQGGEAAARSEKVSKLDTDESARNRTTSDLAVYRYYAEAVGARATCLLILLVVLYAAAYNMPSYWLNVWVNAANPGDLVYWGVYAAFQIIALLLLFAAAYHTFIRVITRAGSFLHASLLKSMMEAPLSFFSSTDNGITINRFSQDLQFVDNELPLALLTLLLTIFLSFGQAALIVVSSPWVGLAFIFLIPVFYAVQNFYLRTSRQLRLLELEAKSPLYTSFLETLNGLSTLRSFGWASEALEANRRLLDSSQKPLYLLYMIQRWLTFVLDMMVACVAIIVVALAVALKSSGGLAGVALTQVMSLSMMLTTIVMQWTVVETSIGSVGRIKTFVENTPSEIKSNEVFEPPLAWPRAGRICLNNVSAFYETNPDSLVLRTVSLSVEGGQKIGICGRSGSGKSSLLLLLSRMLEMEEGSVVIDGVDLGTVPRNMVRARLNIVPQEPVFIPGTVRFNLDPRHESSDSEVVEALRRVHLLDILEAKGGLMAQLDPGFLSHGQRQLFCLAVAILRKASIVLLDEVTSNVDRATDDLMQTIIRKQFRDCTVVAVAHRLSTILDFDQVVVLDCGVVCEVGDPQQLLQRTSRFREMWMGNDG